MYRRVWTTELKIKRAVQDMVGPMPSPYSSTVACVRKALTETFDEIYPWFEIPEQIRGYKPQDSGWSIDEVLEHITLTTHFLMIIVRKGYPKALKRAQAQRIDESESDLEALSSIGRRGSFRWIRPEHMEPTGKVSSQEVLARMRQQQSECLDILSKIAYGEGSLFRVRMSVNELGRIDLYQWLYFIAQHARRHIGQMEENAAEFRSRTDCFPIP